MCCKRALSSVSQCIDRKNSQTNVDRISPSSKRSTSLLPGGLSLKDLQRLDPRLSRSDFCISVKSFAIIIALSDIRALILPHKAYLVVVDGMDGELDILRRTFTRALLPNDVDDDPNLG